MADRLGRCRNCGAPITAGQPCRYCSAPQPDGPEPPPPEIVAAVAATRQRMGDPQGVLRWLAKSVSRLGPGTVRVQRRLVGGIAGLELQLGTIHYRIRQQGERCVVERQAIAAGIPVGMLDVVPASHWPELLTLDVARAADQRGLGWQAVARILA